MTCELSCTPTSALWVDRNLETCEQLLDELMSHTDRTCSSLHHVRYLLRQSKPKQGRENHSYVHPISDGRKSDTWNVTGWGRLSLNQARQPVGGKRSQTLHWPRRWSRWRLSGRMANHSSNVEPLRQKEPICNPGCWEMSDLVLQLYLLDADDWPKSLLLTLVIWHATILTIQHLLTIITAMAKGKGLGG